MAVISGVRLIRLVSVLLVMGLVLSFASCVGNDATSSGYVDGIGEVTLELTYPVGESPKVFTEGWLFGASCIVNKGEADEQDISSQVRWSGSGSFEPDIGETSRPSFEREGRNKIILSISFGNKRVVEEYTVDAVPPFEYAHVGNYSQCPFYTRGCPACPHMPEGPIMSGSPTVLIDGLPAARLGDTGMAGPVCGPAEFVIVEGDPDVIIDGKPAARFGDRTDHSGFAGEVVRTPGWKPSPQAGAAQTSAEPAIANPVLAETETFQITLTWQDSAAAPHTACGSIFEGRFEGNTFKGTTDIERKNITMWSHMTGDCAVTVMPTSDPAVWEITSLSMHLVRNHDRGVMECYVSGDAAIELIGPSELGICQFFVRGEETCKYVNSFSYSEKDNDGNIIRKIEQCPCNEFTQLSIHTT